LLPMRVARELHDQDRERRAKISHLCSTRQFPTD
jgi:hypothetical protein